MGVATHPGNRDEEPTDRRPDCRVFDLARFIRGKRPGARRGCCSWRRLGGRRVGTRGRRGRCVHRIRGWAVDRAFVGNPALRIVIPGSTRGTGRFRRARAADSSRERTAADQIRRVRSGKTKRASGKARHAAGSSPGVGAPDGCAVDVSNNLTRRANHWHSDIIATIFKSPRGEIRRGFFH
jgi:hypothetical protein